MFFLSNDTWFEMQWDLHFFKCGFSKSFCGHSMCGDFQSVEEKDIAQHRTVVSLLQQSACILVLVLEVISVVEQDFCFWPGCLWRLSAEIKRSQSTVSGRSSSCDDLSQLNSWRTFESALWCITRSSWSNEESLLWNKGLTGQKLLASVVLTVSGRLEQLSNS